MGCDEFVELLEKHSSLGFQGWGCQDLKSSLVESGDSFSGGKFFGLEVVCADDHESFLERKDCVALDSQSTTDGSCEG